MRFFHTSRPASRRGKSPALSGVLCGAALLAGCGGGSSSNGNTAQIRAIDAVSNGGSASLSVSGTSVAGSQNYFSSSSYQSLGSGSDPVTFSLSASGAGYPAQTANFQIGNYYSLILVGRADITSAADARYPTVLIASDSFTTASPGQAELRVVQAAPDSGAVDVLVNGAIVAGGVAYKSVTPDLGASSGNVTLQVNQAGRSTILVTPQTVNLTAGHVYTVYVVEPTVTPTPAYGLQETDDTANAFPS